jgi:mRNA-degrading endonuclease toxin of MazEF toxin-antitoxin module
MSETNKSSLPEEYTGRFARGSVHVFKHGCGPLPTKPDRPWLIVSDNVSNDKSNQVIVVALTEWDCCDPRKTEVVLEKSKEAPGLLEKDSLVVCRSIHTAKKSEIHARWGDLAIVSTEKLRAVGRALALTLALRDKP